MFDRPILVRGKLLLVAPLLFVHMSWGAPTAPSNPGATEIAADTIRWTWADNSGNETGFKVWADPGTGTPSTLRHTTLANATFYDHAGLAPNTQYSFQVAATNAEGDSARTAPFSAWTRAAVPTPPVLTIVAATAIWFYIGEGDGNPPTTEYAVKCRTSAQWVQSGGTLGASPVYRTAAAWGITTITGLTPAKPYSFSAFARNGAGVMTEESLYANALTLAIVPDVTGQTEADAATTLNGSMLLVGLVTPQCSNTVPQGRVISQEPAAGRETAAGNAVMLVVSSGMCPVTVPNLVNQTQSAADLLLGNAHLTVGEVTEHCSNTVPQGRVISQDPPSGEIVPYGSGVSYVLSSGSLCPVIVPGVVGQNQVGATVLLQDGHLGVGTVTEQCSNTVAAGLVISQDPAAGAEVPYGSDVDLTVSTGPCNVTVPDVVGLAQSAAVTALAGAGLAAGTVAEQCSSTVAAGFIISQNPVGGSSLPAGGSVDLVVSKGPPPPITGSILINNNRSATNNRAVTLALAWAGGDGGVVRMRFSDDGAHWSAWEPLAATRSYTLPAGSDGHRTVRVQYLDKLNNRSEAFLDYIRLDTAPPTGTIIVNDGAATTSTQSVTLKLTWADGDGAQVSRMRFSDDGAHWSWWMLPENPHAYALPAGPGYHTVRVQYLDGAGNYSAVYSDYIKLVAP